MSALTIFLLTGFSLGMGLTAILLAVAVINNFKTGKALRLELVDKVEQLRYGKMLAKRNISSTEYIHLTPLTEIETGIRKCQECPNTVQCDSILSEEGSVQEPYKFCANAI